MRDFVHHWAPALIGAAFVALVLLVVAGIGLVRSQRHDAEVDRNTAAMSACVTHKMQIRDFDNTMGECLVATMGG